MYILKLTILHDTHSDIAATDHEVMHFFIASFSLRHLKGSNKPISLPHRENAAVQT